MITEVQPPGSRDETALTLIALPFVLSDTPPGSKNFPNGQYLLPDTNAFLTGMDLFEVESAFHDVIVLQTVLEEVKNRSLPLYHRLIALTKNEGKRFYVFFNEFRQETYIPRETGETINDRNDRAVRRAVQWYNQHITQAVKARSKTQERIPSVVMITDDKDNLRKAKAESIPAATRKSPQIPKPTLIVRSVRFRFRVREC